MSFRKPSLRDAINYKLRDRLQYFIGISDLRILRYVAVKELRETRPKPGDSWGAGQNIQDYKENRANRHPSSRRSDCKIEGKIRNIAYHRWEPSTEGQIRAGRGMVPAQGTWQRLPHLEGLTPRQGRRHHHNHHSCCAHSVVVLPVSFCPLY